MFNKPTRVTNTSGSGVSDMTPKACDTRTVSGNAPRGTHDMNAGTASNGSAFTVPAVALKSTRAEF